MGRSATERPYWYPVLADDAWLAQLRKDYPDNADMSDEELQNYYNEDGWKYTDAWDHVGDARDDWEKLADRFLEYEDALADIPNPAAVPAVVEALKGLLSVVSESRGVEGFHLNGDIARWDEFQEVADADAALAALEEEPKT